MKQFLLNIWIWIQALIDRFFNPDPPTPVQPIWKWYRASGAPTPILDVRIRDGNKLGVAMEKKIGEVLNNNQVLFLLPVLAAAYPGMEIYAGVYADEDHDWQLVHVNGVRGWIDAGLGEFIEVVYWCIEQSLFQSQL